MFLLGGARLQKRALERWERGDAPAWESPPLAARIRTQMTVPIGRALRGPRTDES